MSAPRATYQPTLLVASAAPHDQQRYPADARTCNTYGTGRYAGRRVRVMRWADRNAATLEILDHGISIDCELDVTALRRLAFQLLDAAHDIEQLSATAPLELAA